MDEEPREQPQSQGEQGWRWAPTSPAGAIAARDWRLALGVILAAGMLKLVVAFFLFDLSFVAGNENAFGFEVGHIAGNLARGRGFAIEGPDHVLIATAWLSPPYPLFLAGLFKIFGLYTLAAAYAMLVFNCLFQAMTAGLLFLMGLRISGRKAGLLAGAIFVLNPNGWQFLAWAWPSQLFALVLVLHFFSLLVPARNDIAAGAAAGGTLALALLVDGAAIAIAPVALIHFAVFRGRDRLPGTLAGALTCFCLVMAPWTIRNYQQFDSFNPLRGNVGVNLWVGNHPGARAESFHGLSPSPWHNSEEARIFSDLGERDYDRKCRDRAIAAILEEPMVFVFNSGVRFSEYWFGEWWERYSHIPWIYSAGLVILSLLAWAGAFRARNLGSGFLVVALLLFGAPYYLTVHGHGRYRVPIEPLMCLAAALPRKASGARSDEPGRIS